MKVSQGMERQKQVSYQLDIFDFALKATGHDASGDGGTGSGAFEASQMSSATDEQRALASHEVSGVTKLKEPPWYRAGMPGGVRGGEE